MEKQRAGVGAALRVDEAQGSSALQDVRPTVAAAYGFFTQQVGGCSFRLQTGSLLCDESGAMADGARRVASRRESSSLADGGSRGSYRR